MFYDREIISGQRAEVCVDSALDMRLFLFKCTKQHIKILSNQMLSILSVSFVKSFTRTKRRRSVPQSIVVMGNVELKMKAPNCVFFSMMNIKC